MGEKKNLGVIIGNTFFNVVVDGNFPIVEILKTIKENYADPFLVSLDPRKCHFRKVEKQVDVSHLDTADPHVVTELRQETLQSWRKVDSKAIIFKQLNLTENCLHLIIIPETELPLLATQLVRQSPLFASLHIVVHFPLKWSLSDLKRNNATLWRKLPGGMYTEVTEDASTSTRDQDLAKISPSLQSVITRLGHTRKFHRPNIDERDIANCKAFLGDCFDRLFSQTTTIKNTDCDKDEFNDFYQAYRTFLKRSNSVMNNRSSALKISHFTTFMVYPPALIAERRQVAQYVQDLSWAFSTYVEHADHGSAIFKYTPKNDFGLISNVLAIPFLLGEVISESAMKDRWRMLLQAIAAVRVGNLLRKDGIAAPFVVMAIYVTKDLVAEQYLLEVVQEHRACLFSVRIT